MVGGGISIIRCFTKSVESLLAAYPGDAMEDGDSSSVTIPIRRE